jgi:hypothetical protein
MPRKRPSNSHGQNEQSEPVRRFPPTFAFRRTSGALDSKSIAKLGSNTAIAVSLPFLRIARPASVAVCAVELSADRATVADALAMNLGASLRRSAQSV